MYNGEFDEGAGLVGYNVYAYCANNPVMFKDVTGEFLVITLSSTAISLIAAAVVTAGTIILFKAHRTLKNGSKAKTNDKHTKPRPGREAEKKKTKGWLEKSKIGVKYMINELIGCYKKRNIASIYCDPEDSQKHYVGYVESVNDSEILIAHITKNGYYDGYVLRRTNDVYRIDYDGEYEKRIGVLYKAKEQIHKSIDIKNNESLFLAILRFAKENIFVVSLVFEDDCRSGLIKNYNDDIIQLYSLNDNGVEDGIAVVKTVEILAIEVDTDYEQDLKILFNDGSTGNNSVCHTIIP